MTRVRPLDPACDTEIAWVAQHMRETLIEVLGPTRGSTMYSMEWLQERVRWHLRPADCTGQVLLAEQPDGQTIGHTIVRIDQDEAGATLGLISTTYVVPAARRAGVAAALLRAGEDWLIAHGAPTLATNTSDTNWPLIRLYEKHGYQITLRAPEAHMVRLTRPVPQPGA